MEPTQTNAPMEMNDSIDSIQSVPHPLSSASLSANPSGTTETTSVDPLADLTVERILRQRVLGGETQLRVRWEGLTTETWVPRDTLFWRGADAANKVVEFESWAEQNVEQSFIGRPEDPSTVEDTASQKKRTHKKKGTQPHKKRKLTREQQFHLDDELPYTEPGEATPASSEAAEGTAPKKRRTTSHKKKEVTQTLASNFVTQDSDDESVATDALEAEGIYEVEHLLGDVWDDGVHWYRVKWRGYSDFDNSWQRPEDLMGCHEQLEEYWKRKREKREEKEAREKAQRKRQAAVAKQRALAMKDPAIKFQTVFDQFTVANAVATATVATDDGMRLLPIQGGSVLMPPAASFDTPFAQTTLRAEVHDSALLAAPAAFPAVSTPTAPSFSSVPTVPSAATAPSATRLSESDGEEEFVIESFATLQAAQTAPIRRQTIKNKSSTIPTSSDTQARSDAYEAHPPAESDDETRSTASTDSLLIHPQHKHAHDQPQAILSHDWYECENDESQWLVLIKWRNKPVAESSWEPRDSWFLQGSGRRVLLDYQKNTTDARFKKNMKPKAGEFGM